MHVCQVAQSIGMKMLHRIPTMAYIPCHAREEDGSGCLCGQDHNQKKKQMQLLVVVVLCDNYHGKLLPTEISAPPNLLFDIINNGVECNGNSERNNTYKFKIECFG